MRGRELYLLRFAVSTHPAPPNTTQHHPAPPQARSCQLLPVTVPLKPQRLSLYLSLSFSLSPSPSPSLSVTCLLSPCSAQAPIPCAGNKITLLHMFILQPCVCVDDSLSVCVCERDTHTHSHRHTDETPHSCWCLKTTRPSSSDRSGNNRAKKKRRKKKGNQIYSKAASPPASHAHHAAGRLWRLSLSYLCSVLPNNAIALLWLSHIM